MDFKFDPNENEGKIPYLATIYEPREDEKIIFNLYVLN